MGICVLCVHLPTSASPRPSQRLIQRDRDIKRSFNAHHRTGGTTALRIMAFMRYMTDAVSRCQLATACCGGCHLKLATSTNSISNTPTWRLHWPARNLRIANSHREALASTGYQCPPKEYKPVRFLWREVRRRKLSAKALVRSSVQRCHNHWWWCKDVI